MLHRAGAFSRLATSFSARAGHPLAFAAALFVVLVWLATGPLFHFSDTWQLVINTATTIVTFLMVFLIQNAQTRDSEAVQIKLDELIRSHPRAQNALLDLEELSDEELVKMRDRYEAMARKARSAHRARARRKRGSTRGRRPVQRRHA